MRKNIAFAMAATVLGMVMIFWAKSVVVATHAEVIRPTVGWSPYVVMPNPYLPIRGIEEVY